MLPEAISETIALVAMFAIRIGIPVAITLALGYWLEKKLRPAETGKEGLFLKTDAVRRPKSSKIIQLHCWDVRKCDSSKVAHCAASKHPELPCWLAIQVEGGKVREECFTCRLYKPESIAA